MRELTWEQKYDIWAKHVDAKSLVLIAELVQTVEELKGKIKAFAI
jgi:hypothetical protein